MRYYLIAGEASGDIHASHLIAAIRRLDTAAQFRCFGGDMMAAEGAELVQHYRDLAYMGFWPVVCHLPTILRGMKKCQRDILAWRPDILILVDYPGFNLRMARFVKQHTAIPVAYYIAPKIWAWKEGRIRDIKRDVDLLLSILPFEKDFYEKKHGCAIHYVGNPTVDEVVKTLSDSPSKGEDDGRPIIALLPGSRKQEVRDNLRRMLQAAEPYAKDYQLVLAAAPGLEDEFYEQCIKKANAKWQKAERLNAQSSIFNLQFSIFNSQSSMINVVRGQTYQLLQHSTAALVTSGTATLETALFRVPQVVCYYIRAGRLASLAKRLFLKVPFISLVNLICGEEVVPELVAEQMTTANVRRHLASILPGGTAREAQLKGYERLAAALGEPGAAARAAKIIVQYVAMPSQQSITLKP
ncbi:MAG: lipid-A-disaccharide synthase [Bacteroidaceae bacterium]|nr:lipid-A-disaccharide synthase [Bacteroidaceae bacterium]